MMRLTGPRTDVVRIDHLFQENKHERRPYLTRFPQIRKPLLDVLILPPPTHPTPFWADVNNVHLAGTKKKNEIQLLVGPRLLS